MRLNTQGRYAVSTKIDASLHEQSVPVSLAAISARQKISLSYLEQMFSKLRKQGLVKRMWGPGDGYCPGRVANAIRVVDIIDAVDSKRPHMSTDKHLQGTATMPDMTKNLWDALNSKMRDHLQSITLRTLPDEQCAKSVQMSHRLAATPGAFTPHKDKTSKVNVSNLVFALAKCC